MSDVRKTHTVYMNIAVELVQQLQAWAHDVADFVSFEGACWLPWLA